MLAGLLTRRPPRAASAARRSTADSGHLQRGPDARRPGLATDPTAFDGRSDYGPFIAADIPAGGLFTGAEEPKTPEQAQRFGGTAGQPDDPCYHQACDRVDNIDRTALDRNVDAFAGTIGRFALSTDGIPA